MKCGVVVVFVLACVSLDAQISATLNRLRGGATEITIRNDSALSLAAFAIRVNVISQPNAPFVSYYDPVIDSTAEPLPPYQERALPQFIISCQAAPMRASQALSAALQNRSDCGFGQPVVTAGIFSDGSTTGDAALLAGLMVRRSNMLLAVETVLDLLAEAGRHNVPRAQLVERFTKMADSVNRWYLPPEQRVGGSLYQSVAGKLLNLPDEPLGSAFPPDAFVMQETAMLRRQRVALLESQPSLADAARAGSWSPRH